MRAVLFLIMCGLAWAAQGETIELPLTGNLVARADYRKGTANKPAVIMLHGFLQTYEFPTIHRLAEGMADAGHTVLLPNLTLGITHRRQSLACEAIHTHTMQDAGREIDAWLKWLKTRHSGPIVLLGHSFGSVELLAYLSKRRDPAISRLIGVSIVEGRIKLSPTETGKLIGELRQAVITGTPRVVTHPFSFCRKFQATPASLLSYLEWTPQKVLDASARLPLPSLFIMGESDDRLGPGWVEQLDRRNRVTVIPGANHFMDGNHEFDLLDVVLNELKAS